jgi:hypothetical protein
MTDLNRTAPPYTEPPRAPRAPMRNMGPLFSTLDMAAGIAAAVMTLGPLARAAFAVGRY